MHIFDTVSLKTCISSTVGFAQTVATYVFVSGLPQPA
jgi:hypothetical protein